MKKKLLIFSDCFTFGGSEYVVVNILKSKNIQAYFDLIFAYREHREYNFYVNRLLSEERNVSLVPIKIWSNATFFHNINKKIKNKYLRYLIKLPMWLLSQIGPYEWNNNRLFRKLLREIKPDLIHVNNGGYPASESCLYLTICAKKNGIKNILQINNCALPISFKSRRDKKVEKSTDAFITATEYARKELAQNRHFDINKIITLFNAVDLPHPQKKRDLVCKELGINPDNFIITEVALLEQRKGQIPFLKSLLELEKIDKVLYDKTIILLVGNGEDESAIRNFISLQKLESKVLLLGYRMDYIDIVNASDVFALPSLYNEDMPLSILSAMALSKPILSSNIAGIPEEVKDGINGYLVDPLSTSFEYDIAICIIRTFNNLETFGNASFVLYSNNFNRKIYETQLLHIYNSIIQSNNDIFQS